MKESEVLAVLERVGARIRDSHFVLASKRHASEYLNKDAIYPETEQIAKLCVALGQKFADPNVETVIAPAIGGVIISQRVAAYLTRVYRSQAYSVYAEKAEDGQTFVIKRGYDRFITGRKVLVVEDILTTGGSVRKVVEAVRGIGGQVIGVAALCNRGGVTTADLGNVPRLVSLANLTLESWSEEECPLCQRGVPINTAVGKGQEFLARRKQSV